MQVKARNCGTHGHRSILQAPRIWAPDNAARFRNDMEYGYRPARGDLGYP